METINSALDFCDVIDFCRKLEESHDETWEDLLGEYRVSIGVNRLEERICDISRYEIISGKKLYDNLKKDTHIHSQIIISIGSFETHNIARIKCLSEHKELITVPAPLSNDSFGTNRVNYPNEISSKNGVFPTETIFDFSLINKLPLNLSVLGIGEFVGLYFSVIDYCITRKQPIPLNVLDYIVSLIKALNTKLDQSKNSFLNSLSTGLTFKCLVMRKNQDHQIGCGIDHLLGKALENSLNIAHGEAVYLSGIITLLFFPEWEKFGLSLSDMLTIGRETKILSGNLLNNLSKLSYDQILQASLQSRPERPSMLRADIFTTQGYQLWEKLSSDIRFKM